MVQFCRVFFQFKVLKRLYMTMCKIDGNATVVLYRSLSENASVEAIGVGSNQIGDSVSSLAGLLCNILLWPNLFQETKHLDRR
jgi:hypothetical protein